VSVENEYMITKLVSKFGYGLSFILMMMMAVICSACAKDKDMILELKDVQFFQVQPMNSSIGSIKLSGLVFHSSLAIKNISTSLDDEKLQVLVHLTPTSSGLSGNLIYNLVIPDKVNAVTFGNENVVIWNRSTGEVKSK